MWVSDTKETEDKLTFDRLELTDALEVEFFEEFCRQSLLSFKDA